MLICPPRHHALETKVFAEVEYPGHPLGVAADRRRLYVGTHRTVDGKPGVASHVYAYDRRGEVTDDWTIEGQAEAGQGIAGIALDHDGVLYIVDQAPSRIITLDPRSGEQELYAELPDVALCSAEDGEQARAKGCSEASADRPAQPINLAFGPCGDLYVGDLTQAAIWRVPRGGGEAEVWYTAADLDSLFGPNTIHFLSPRKILFAQSAHGLLDPADLMQAKGRLYTLEIGRDGKPGKRELFWEAEEDGETPDGFAVGESGNVYVALAIANQLLVLDKHGREVARVPESTEENEAREVPFDLPGGVAFFGDRLIVTNQAFLGGPEEHQVLFSLDVGEEGARLYRPRVRRG